MRILKALMIIILLLFLPAYALSSDIVYMRISLMEGDVQINTPEAGDWGLASINSPVEEGDQVWVPEGGRVELQLNTGTYIRLDQNSALQILSMDKDSYQFYLSQGNAYIYYNASAGSVIQVDTPDASTRAFDGAVFRIDISDQYTDVAVYKGYIETENKVGNTSINAGEMLSFGQDTNGEVGPMGPPDEWEKWNKSRNETIFTGEDESTRYLPAELRQYSYDFNNNGRWVQVPDYGYCWVPTVVVGANWAPYREGRWIWRGGDYVWVAYESWGWAPYHYGRWAFVGSVGWCWIPPSAGEVYWGPGYVGWVRTADYVAWVPLAPGDIYYGRGYHGRHSVNITNIDINRVNITHVYKNVHVNNGVTIVNRSTFATASPRIVNVNQNIVRQKIFVKNNISIGTPAIKPSRASYFVSDKPIPHTKLPPQIVRHLQVKELKQSRPFVKTRDRSVLNQGERPKPLPVKTITVPRTPGKGRPLIQPGQHKEKSKLELPGKSKERPTVTPAETIKRQPVKKKEEGKPPTEKRLKEQPTVMPEETIEKQPVKKTEEGKPPTGRRLKERPTFTPGETIEKPPVKKKEGGKPEGQEQEKEKEKKDKKTEEQKNKE